MSRRITTADERYLISMQEGMTREELYKDIPETSEPMTYTHEVARQQKYRRIRQLSQMSRDQPPRLPCRPWCDNGDEYLWTCPGRKKTPYQQPRVDQRRIKPYSGPECHVCYTCMDHRLCIGPICPASAFTCFFCRSKEGPLRVRAKRLAKRVVERPGRFD